jgi:hypothetical protein
MVLLSLIARRASGAGSLDSRVVALGVATHVASASISG